MSLKTGFLVLPIDVANSIFLPYSDGGTPQNIRFNSFAIFKSSIHGENNTWHVKSWRLTLEVDRTTPGVLLFPTSLIYVNLCKIGKVKQSRNIVDPFTAHDTARWWAYWQDLYARS